MPMHHHAARLRLPLTGALCALAIAAPVGAARACDGKSYSFSIQVGGNVSAGGLTVRLDKAKFINDTPDKYTISVKDDGNMLADGALLVQYDTLKLPTKCGTVSIGADRKGMFAGHTLTITWSYF